MNIVMSGSGSGGHIYPCISLYNKLKETDNITIIIFKEIDKKIYDLNNISYIYIDNYLSNLEKYKLIKKVFKENKIERSITFGGKNSLIINLVAKSFKVKVYIFEQNAILGKANKINYLLCDKIFSNFRLNLKKEINVGNPNSFEIKKDKVNYFNNNKITILITLGSLGSSSVNKIIEQFILDNKKYNIIYVTGNNVKCDIKENNHTKIIDYFNPLTTLMNSSDIIISRAGASTLSEIIQLNKVSIIIPSPYVSNNHQYKNALKLLKVKAIEFINEKDLSLNLLKTKLYLLNNKSYYESIKNNINLLKKPNNFTKIIKEIKR